MRGLGGGGEGCFRSGAPTVSENWALNPRQSILKENFHDHVKPDEDHHASSSLS